MCLSLYLSIHVSVCTSTRLHVNPSASLSVSTSVSLFLCLFISPSLSVLLSICLSVCLFIYHHQQFNVQTVVVRKYSGLKSNHCWVPIYHRTIIFYHRMYFSTQKSLSVYLSVCLSCCQCIFYRSTFVSII